MRTYKYELVVTETEDEYFADISKQYDSGVSAISADLVETLATCGWNVELKFKEYKSE